MKSKDLRDRTSDHLKELEKQLQGEVIVKLPDGSVIVPTMFPFPDVWAITGKVEQSENTKAVTATLSALTKLRDIKQAPVCVVRHGGPKKLARVREGVRRAP